MGDAFYRELLQDGCWNAWVYVHETEKAVRLRNMDDVRAFVQPNYGSEKHKYDVLNFLVGLTSSPDNENKHLLLYVFDRSTKYGAVSVSKISSLHNDRWFLSDLVGLKGDWVGLKGDRVGLKGDWVGLKGDRVGLKNDRVGLKGDQFWN